MRNTKARTQILNIFKKETHPISAIDLLEKVKVNKTTIYRELDFLLEKGIINEVIFGDNMKRYELSDLKHHHHLICINCHKVENIEMNEKFNIPNNFKVLKHNLEFFGYCFSCQ